jgi:hypothetical protein
MAADEMQVHLKAKDDLTKELVNATKRVQKLEAQLRDLDGATGPEAERDVRRLTTQLDKAYRQSKTLTGAVDNLDDKLDAMGHSATSADRKMSGLGRSMDGTQRSSKSMASGWGKLIGVVAGVTAAVEAAGFAFRFLGDSIEEARAARKAMAQTAAVMRSMGRTEAPKRISKMIDDLEAMSGIDGDNLREMTNVLLTFGNVTDKTFEKANSLALDLSVAFSKDLQSSAVMVGKALNDPTKGLTALTRIGVAFTSEQQEQIKAMMDVNDVAGAQKIIMRELERQVGGSAEAQADGIAKTQVAYDNLKEQIGEVLMSTGDLLAGTTNADFAEGIRNATTWIRKHTPQIQEALAGIAGSMLRVGEYALRAGAMVTESYGWIMAQIGGMLKVLGKLGIPKMNEWGDALIKSSNSAHEAAGSMQTTADRMAGLADKTFSARDRLKELNTALDQLDGKKVRIRIRATMTDVWDAVDAATNFANDGGDTTVGMGVGSLGAAGLAAAHAGYSSALGGHSILSGVRGSNLGSVHSDHRHGRAMDIRGPRLGAYAQVVRRSGGYAAMHGTGGNRHLHVVPQTRRPQPQMAGGNTFHADVTVVNPGAEMDIQGAVARGLRQAARQTKERG